MPPRHVYWTIIAGGQPTAFRAAEREELLPTLKQLQSRHPDATMMWFARGKLWPTKEAADFALRQERGGGGREPRGRDWRPGGEHKDPRDRFKVPRDEKRRRFAERMRHDRHEEADKSGERPERPQRPWRPKADRPFQPKGDRPPGDRSFRPKDRPAWSKRPASPKPRGGEGGPKGGGGRVSPKPRSGEGGFKPRGGPRGNFGNRGGGGGRGPGGNRGGGGRGGGNRGGGNRGGPR